MTKAMKPYRLVSLLESGILDLHATPEGQIAKMRKQKRFVGELAGDTPVLACTDDLCSLTKKVTGVSYRCIDMRASRAFRSQGP